MHLLLKKSKYEKKNREVYFSVGSTSALWWLRHNYCNADMWIYILCFIAPILQHVLNVHLHELVTYLTWVAKEAQICSPRAFSLSIITASCPTPPVNSADFQKKTGFLCFAAIFYIYDNFTQSTTPSLPVSYLTLHNASVPTRNITRQLILVILHSEDVKACGWCTKISCIPVLMFRRHLWYNVRELAWFRASQNRCKFFLASWI